MTLNFFLKLIILVFLTWKYEKFFRAILLYLLKIDHFDELKRSDYKFSAVSKICFESVENSETNAVSKKKLIKTAWITIFEKSEKSVRSCQNKNWILENLIDKFFLIDFSWIIIQVIKKQSFQKTRKYNKQIKLLIHCIYWTVSWWFWIFLQWDSWKDVNQNNLIF